jgi:hypothetical protein
MANITNPLIIAFTNDRVRRLALIARLLKAETTNMNVKYSSEVQTLLNAYADSDVIIDGQPNYISPLTKKDVNDLVYSLAVNTQNYVDATLEKACVRPLLIQENIVV